MMGYPLYSCLSGNKVNGVLIARAKKQSGKRNREIRQEEGTKNSVTKSESFVPRIMLCLPKGFIPAKMLPSSDFSYLEGSFSLSIKVPTICLLEIFPINAQRVDVLLM
jgi:hypothetical protein